MREKKIRKLTPEQVKEIRKALEEGKLQEELAVTYGVRQGTISRIKRKQLWKHL